MIDWIPDDYHSLPKTKKIRYDVVQPAHKLNEARVAAMRGREATEHVPSLLAHVAWVFFVCADKLLLVCTSSYSRRIQTDGAKMHRLLAILMYVFPLALFVAFARVALAQDMPATLPNDVGGIVAWFKQTHEAGEWSLVIGGAVTLLVRLLTLLKPLADKLPPEATKWLAMGLAMLGSIATGLMAKIAWYKVILDGLQVGAAALGGWEFILKPLLDKLGLSKVPTGPITAAPK